MDLVLIKKTPIKKMSEVLKANNFNKVIRIIEYLQDKGSITPKEAERLCGKSVATRRRYMKMLVETGYLEQEDNTNNIVYKVLI